MARTIQEIYDTMVAEKQGYEQLNALQPAVDNSQQLLSNLSSTSKVATWRLFYFVVAVCVWTLETLFDKHKEEITYLVENNHYGNRTWYEIKAKEFQIGDDLTVINGVVKYEVEDVTKRIVKYAASVPGTITQVKIAGEDNGNLVKITSEVLLQVQTYFNKIKPFGTRVSVTSNDADKLKIIADVYYNPLVLNASGVKISDGTKPVELAIKSFLKTIEFDGKLNVQKLTDAIQDAIGCEDVDGLQIFAKYGTTNYVAVSRQYFSYAGWMEVDTDFPLDVTLTYKPNV